MGIPPKPEWVGYRDIKHEGAQAMDQSQKTQDRMMERYQKQVINLRAWCQGRRYHRAGKAIRFAQEIHTGFRKDGVTPEFAHQIAVTQYIRTVADQLLYPEETIAAGLLHDTPEDYDVDYGVLVDMFGKVIADASLTMSKKYQGTSKTPEAYFGGMAKCPISSVGKGGDRIHNFQSMVGVFTHQGQVKYMEEAELWILPMLKEARRRFPEQEPVYQNEQLVLESQIHLIREIHKAAKEAATPKGH